MRAPSCTYRRRLRSSAWLAEACKGSWRAVRSYVLGRAPEFMVKQDQLLAAVEEQKGQLSLLGHASQGTPASLRDIVGTIACRKTLAVPR